jgi:hypothetical protein
MDGHVDDAEFLAWDAAFGDAPAAHPPGPPLNGHYHFNGVVSGLDLLGAGCELQPGAKMTAWRCLSRGASH